MSRSFRHRVSGLVAGAGVVCGLVFTGIDPVRGVNAGMVALVVNLAVALAVIRLGRGNRGDGRPDEEVLARDPQALPVVGG